MNKARVTALVVMSAALAFGAPQQKKDWVKYNSAEGRYSVLFPNEPELETQEVTAAATGEKFTQYRATSYYSANTYGVAYFDHRGGTFSFDEARDGVIASLKATLLAEKAISLGRYRGRELRFSAKVGVIEVFVLMRYYVVGKRIYIVQFAYQRSSGNSSAEKAAKFFDSFTVVEPQ